MKRQLMLAVCLTVVVVALLLLMGGEGLADTAGIYFPPLFWVEQKGIRYYPDGHQEYAVYGWWFEESPHTFPSEPGVVDVTYDVYEMMLRPWVNGLPANLCQFEFKDGEPAASKYFCYQGSQVFLPVVE